jgi:hypothetical protein
MDTTPTSPLARFRTQLYQDVLGLRRDALCELLDAVLTGEQATSLVRHSLSPAFRRGWASAPDALADGSLDVAALRRVFAQHTPAPPGGRRDLWVLDGSIWPRPEAKTCPERTWGRFVTAGTPESGIIGAWEYQWLVQLPEDQGSWGLPLEVGRRDLAAGTATTLAIGQLRAALAARPPTAPRPLVVLDSHYDVVELLESGVRVDILARLAANRRFYRQPGPYAGLGAPRKHGPIFRCAAPSTHGLSDRSQFSLDPDYGLVRIDIWERLHVYGDPGQRGAPAAARHATRPAVVSLERGSAAGRSACGVALVSTPLRGGAPVPLPQAGAGLDDDPSPVPADGRSLELAAGGGAVAVVVGACRGGRPAAALGTPTRGGAQSGTGAPGLWRTCAHLGHPGSPPRPRGKSPGRQTGQCPGPAPRCPVLRRGPPRAA